MPSNKKADKKTRASASTAAARAKGSASRSKSVTKSLAKSLAKRAATGASKTGASRSGASKTKAAAAKTRGGAASANKTAARAATSSSRKTSVKSSAKNAPKKAAKVMKSKTANSAKSAKGAVRKVAAKAATTRAATRRVAASARNSTARSVSAAKTRVSKTQTAAKKPTTKAAVAAKAAKISAAKTSAKTKTAALKTAAKTAQIVVKNKKAPQAPVTQAAKVEAAKVKAGPATAIKAPVVKQPIAAKAAPPKPAAPAVAAASVQPKPAVAQQVQPLSKRPPGHSYIPPSHAARQQQGMRAPVPGLHPASPIVKAKPTASQKLGFKLNEFIVYPAHGVGQITGVEIQEVAGFSLELFVVSFIKDKMILKVPTSKVDNVGMRKLAEGSVVDKALTTLSGRARIKRTMWSRRAQEYEAKINSGDLITIAEVVRDLYRSDTQPEQSYSERQLYEAALDRMAREIAAVRKLIDSEALKLIESYLLKGPKRGQKSDADSVEDAPDETDVDRAA